MSPEPFSFQAQETRLTLYGRAVFPLRMMKKEYKKVKLSTLTPYANNPRKNDDAVDAVAGSIEQVGYITPIIADENGELLAGHTRLRAMHRQGIDEAEVLFVYGLTDQQKRKFRLLDNKTTELAKWDLPKLKTELADLDFADLEIDWGISWGAEEGDEEEDDGYYGDERERTYDSYNLGQYDPYNVAGFYQMPVLDPCYTAPDGIISFNYMLTAKETNVGVHFFCDDYQFERLWNRPFQYTERMGDFQCVFTPDFSLYLDMPMAMKVWNVYRSRLIGQIMQREGLDVIPTVSWAEPETFAFAFDGLPTNSVVATSTIGVKQDDNAMDIWTAGMDAMIDRLSPSLILVYGGAVDYDYHGVDVKYYENITLERMSGKG